MRGIIASTMRAMSDNHILSLFMISQCMIFINKNCCFNLYSDLRIGDNKIAILPPWIYRQKRFTNLYTVGMNSVEENSKYNSKLQLRPSDFKTAAVPSLFEIAAKCIITERCG